MENLYNNKAFTLIELLAVILIIALVSAIVVPNISSITYKKNSTMAKLSYTQIVKLIKEENAKTLNDSVSVYTVSGGKITYMSNSEIKNITYNGELTGEGIFEFDGSNIYGYYLENKVCVYKSKLSNGEINVENNISSLPSCRILYENS